MAAKCFEILRQFLLQAFDFFDFFFFFLMIRRPPRSTLFPYTDALPISSHGCDHIFVDEDASGSNRDRPALQQALGFAEASEIGRAHV